ncbi:dihydrofolate reductase [Anguilla anguilla]|uniref:dihydrofolate reductase n=1 Tax=Anguilla anguilla TaxID=7936 RepID=A0A9D3RK69_ANGAN|nr:dihydrofolate reductase [Anguilla anguilla]KAG5830847.1 hypothetical protein ANANG_G00314900 [Anguilla anguilla]
MFTGEGKVRSKPIRVIAAACNNMGIGKDGHLPWSLPREFQFFLDAVRTVSKPDRKNLIIWGRETWFSAPKGLFPIANSVSVVLSNTLSAVPERAHHLCRDFEGAVQLATAGPAGDQVETIWVVGGAEVYRKALEHPWCDLVYLTHIMADFDCDTFFPPLDRSIYALQDRFPGVQHKIQEENGIRYKFQVFKRNG